MAVFPVEDIITSDIAKEIISRIDSLPNEAKFRAYNAIQSLNWASHILHKTGFPIPATYCGLHATEEAVAAFVCCAKFSGYRDLAKKINIRDHIQKSAVSLVVQNVIKVFTAHSVKLALAFHKETKSICLRITEPDAENYSVASLSLFHFLDEEGVKKSFFDEFMAVTGSVEHLKEEVARMANARNKIFYADENGYSTGFDDHVAGLIRDTQLTLGLIWACTEIHTNKATSYPFITQALTTIDLVIDAVKGEKR